MSSNFLKIEPGIRMVNLNKDIGQPPHDTHRSTPRLRVGPSPL